MYLILRSIYTTLAKRLCSGLASVFVSGILILGSFGGAYAQESSYVLGANDVIAISVYMEEDLSFEEIRIGDSGKINYPFLGEIQAVGNTVSGFESLIRKGLIDGEFLIDPAVTVRIVEYRPFYIDGEVEEPGAYPFEPGLTLRKAISIAGGFTERASRRGIEILPEGASQNDDPEVTDNLDISLKPGDIITIEERFF
jgi:protein involved in polysaccharide export with SLBB domain